MRDVIEFMIFIWLLIITLAAAVTPKAKYDMEGKSVVIHQDTLMITKADNGDVLHLGENSLKIIHTPGHNRGSICIHTDNILISGDTLFNQSIGRTDYYGGNFDTLISSIKKRIFVLDDNTKVYPGHGSDTTIGYEINNNPFIR